MCFEGKKVTFEYNLTDLEQKCVTDLRGIQEYLLKRLEKAVAALDPYSLDYQRKRKTIIAEIMLSPAYKYVINQIAGVYMRSTGFTMTIEKETE